MLAYTYIKQGKFELIEKPKPELRDSRDAIVRVTLGSICTSDLHIKHGGVPRAVPGITVGHEMVGIVEQTGRDVKLCQTRLIELPSMWKPFVENVFLPAWICGIIVLILMGDGPWDVGLMGADGVCSRTLC